MISAALVSFYQSLCLYLPGGDLRDERCGQLTAIRSTQIPGPKLLRQQENRRADQDPRSAQGLHADASCVGVGNCTGHDSDSGDDEAAAFGREFRFEGSGTLGRGEKRDAWYFGLAEAARKQVQ